jgi:hypothetical protein
MDDLTESARRDWTNMVLRSCDGEEAPPYCDIIFHCADGKSAFAVRGMLAMNSPVLYSMFYNGSMLESKAAECGRTEMTIPFRETPVKAFLAFCTTGVIQTNRETVLELLMLADYYGVVSLFATLIAIILQEAEDDIMAKAEDGAPSSSRLIDCENVVSALECACACQSEQSEKLVVYCLDLLERNDLSPAVLLGQHRAEEEGGTPEWMGSLQNGGGGGEGRGGVRGVRGGRGQEGGEGGGSDSSSKSSSAIDDDGRGSALDTLSCDALCAMLGRDGLALEEVEVFEAVVRWGKAQLRSLLIDNQSSSSSSSSSDEGMKDVKPPPTSLASVCAKPLASVRFPLMTPMQLVTVVQPLNLVDPSVIIEALAYQADPHTATRMTVTDSNNNNNNNNNTDAATADAAAATAAARESGHEDDEYESTSRFDANDDDDGDDDNGDYGGYGGGGDVTTPGGCSSSSSAVELESRFRPRHTLANAMLQWQRGMHNSSNSSSIVFHHHSASLFPTAAAAAAAATNAAATAATRAPPPSSSSSGSSGRLSSGPTASNTPRRGNTSNLTTPVPATAATASTSAAASAAPVTIAGTAQVPDTPATPAHPPTPPVPPLANQTNYQSNSLPWQSLLRLPHPLPPPPQGSGVPGHLGSSQAHLQLLTQHGLVGGGGGGACVVSGGVNSGGSSGGGGGCCFGGFGGCGVGGCGGIAGGSSGGFDGGGSSNSSSSNSNSSNSNSSGGLDGTRALSSMELVAILRSAGHDVHFVDQAQQHHQPLPFAGMGAIYAPPAAMVATTATATVPTPMMAVATTAAAARGAATRAGSFGIGQGGRSVPHVNSGVGAGSVGGGGGAGGVRPALPQFQPQPQEGATASASTAQTLAKLERLEAKFEAFVGAASSHHAGGAGGVLPHQPGTGRHT